MPSLSVSNIIVFFILLTFDISYSQQSDLELIESKNIVIKEFETTRKVTYLFKDNNWIIKYNPVSVLFGGLLYVYQKYISIQIAANCPYEVSCSAFSKQCIQRYGLLYGIPLTADRLTRCTRLASFDLIRGVEYNSRTNKIYDHPEQYKLFRK